MSSNHHQKKRKREEKSFSSEKPPTIADSVADQLPIPSPSSFPKFVKSFWKFSEHETELSDELKQLRKSLGVLVKGQLETCPPPITTLVSNPNIPTTFAKYFNLKELIKPTPIQAQCWPAILAGNNVLGIAPTGSGKTLAYVLPMIHHVNNQNNIKHTKGLSSAVIFPSGLILIPTRELALQVHAVLKTCKSLAPSVAAGIVYGGQDKQQQIDKLRSLLSATKTMILVATPGRLLDLLQEKESSDMRVDLTNVTSQVIDEADRMLSLGFAEQLTTINSLMCKQRQMVLYSATFPGKLRELSDLWAPNICLVRCNAVNLQDSSQTPMVIFERESKTQKKSEAIVQPIEEAIQEDGAKEEEVVEETKGKKAKTNRNEESKSKSTVLDDETAQVVVNKPMKEESNEINKQNAIEDGAEAKEEDEVEEEEVESSFQQGTTDAITINPSIQQVIHICAAHKRPRLLFKYIEAIRQLEKETKQRQAEPMMIFVNKIKTLKYVVDFLTRQKVICLSLHGQLPQSKREENLLVFKSGKVNILVATDVAARGIHIKRLRYVVNYDFPSNIEQYCHRIGRTGRMNEIGIGCQAYSLMTRNFAPLAKDLIALLKTCGVTPEPNLEKLAADHALGNVDINLDDIDLENYE